MKIPYYISQQGTINCFDNNLYISYTLSQHNSYSVVLNFAGASIWRHTRPVLFKGQFPFTPFHHALQPSAMQIPLFHRKLFNASGSGAVYKTDCFFCRSNRSIVRMSSGDVFPISRWPSEGPIGHMHRSDPPNGGFLYTRHYSHLTEVLLQALASAGQRILQADACDLGQRDSRLSTDRQGLVDLPGCAQLLRQHVLMLKTGFQV